MEYTSKLNKMFTDMSLSNDLNTSFRDYLRQNSYKLNGKCYLLYGYSVTPSKQSLSLLSIISIMKILHHYN